MPQKQLQRTAQINIAQAMDDVHIFGRALGPPKSWQRWKSVLKGAFAIPLLPAEQVMFAEVAGNRPPPQKRVSELHITLGRRSGKTRSAALTAVYTAAIEKHTLAPGEIGHVLLLAASRDQAKTAFEYVIGFLQASPLLKQEIESITANEVRLRNYVVIGVHAGNF